jgi:predicted DNA-binding protein (MmcQ/YjbR family)
MHVEWVRDFCLSFDDVEECQPFGPENLVYKINGKIFLLISLDDIPPRINIKTDPDKSEELREAYPDNILPGFHMNKKHWNTMHLNRYLPQNKVLALIKASHSLIKK